MPASRLMSFAGSSRQHFLEHSRLDHDQESLLSYILSKFFIIFSTKLAPFEGQHIHPSKNYLTIPSSAPPSIRLTTSRNHVEALVYGKLALRVTAL